MTHQQAPPAEKAPPPPLFPSERESRISGTGALPRVIPFILFMACIGVEQAATLMRSLGFINFGDASLHLFYPLRPLAAGMAIWAFRSRYIEFRLRDLAQSRHLAASLFTGLAVLFLWIGIEQIKRTGGNPHGFNPTLFTEPTIRWFMISARLIGAVIIVPIMEELFWRSFLIRYVVKPDFQQVPIGLFTWPSFAATVLLFGLEHHLIIAGMVAGAAYNLLLYYTRSIAHCTLAHTITNLLLGLYVLYTGSWYFW